MLIQSPKKILVMKLRSLGDTVLMTAALAELRAAFPNAEIHAAVTSTWAPLLEGHPALQKLWTYDRYHERAARAKAATRLALKLRREKFDCVVNLHASPSSAMVAFATGAKTRSIHFHGHKDRNRYTTVDVPGKGILKPIIERDMDAVRALGVHVPAGRVPKIYLQDTETKAAAEWTHKLGLRQPLMMIGLGASRTTKRWPVERYALLAIEWAMKKHGGVLAVAGPNESDDIFAFLKSVDDLLLNAIPDSEKRAEVRSQITSENHLPLRQLAALISKASVFVGNDSGPRHLAVAVGTPTLTLFGPEHPFEWHPYSSELHPHIFLEGLACRRDALPGYPAWCGIEPCVVEQHRCMREIGVDHVYKECAKLTELARG